MILQIYSKKTEWQNTVTALAGYRYKKRNPGLTGFSINSGSVVFLVLQDNGYLVISFS